MFAVVPGGMIIFVKQAVQDGNGLPAALGSGEFAAGPDQAFVAVGNVAATGVTHSVYSVKLTVSGGSMCRCVAVTVSLQQFNAAQYQFVTTDEFGVPVTAVAADQS